MTIFRRCSIFVYVLLILPFCSFAQQVNQHPEADITDIIKKIFKKDTSLPSSKKQSTVAILPSIGYNPSIGFQLGANITGGKYLGNKDSTTLSIFSFQAFYTTKKVLTIQLRHNVFTKNNLLNFQGNWQFSKSVTLDYGPGSGIVSGTRGAFSIGGIPVTNDSATYPMKFSYFRFTERAYKKIAPHLYAGVGFSFDIRENIDDQQRSKGRETPHHTYSVQNGYDTLKYSANGLLVDLQYNTREHPNRSYRGIYTDVGLRFNQGWLGSTKNSIQLLTEFRKYWSLSAAHPAHVLAFWHWGSYLLSGSIPYLEMSGIGSDVYARSGRGYTIGAIKGLSYFYSELEYRFPILANGFMSGVTFTNVSSASNQQESKLFKYWEPAVGAGLRFLFKKSTRTNICLDYAIGRYGSGGIFFGLNEVF